MALIDGVRETCGDLANDGWRDLLLKVSGDDLDEPDVREAGLLLARCAPMGEPG